MADDKAAVYKIVLCALYILITIISTTLLIITLTPTSTTFIDTNQSWMNLVYGVSYFLPFFLCYLAIIWAVFYNPPSYSHIHPDLPIFALIDVMSCNRWRLVDQTSISQWCILIIQLILLQSSLIPY